ncbi:MAG: PocR ligand-binding domain-containing protein [Clostridia bacterium]|nr:PocR ligand-binding domain-containing protein [Clostridia bacterium]
MLVKVRGVQAVIVKFNIEQLDNLLYQFYLLTGMTVSVWDANYNQLSYQPREIKTYCRLIKESAEGRKRCLESDKHVCAACAQSLKPETHYCHAGILDTAVPIQYKRQILGFLMFGQVTKRADEPGATERTDRLSGELGIDRESLQKAYRELDQFDNDKIQAAAMILKAATRYLWLSEYIEVEYSNHASKVNDYIHEHIGEKLTVQRLCEVFDMSKNKLYDLSNYWFDMPIGDYINSVRIERAKQLLIETDYPIGKIGEIVGVIDYNYFTKFFKAHAGMSPLKYRKSHTAEPF